MKILVTGSRNWTSHVLIDRELSLYPSGGILVHGGACGADSIAAMHAPHRGFEVRAYPVDWDAARRVLGKRWKLAGHLRNAWMLEAEQPELVLAFPMPGARGTIDMIERSHRAGVPVVVVNYRGVRITILPRDHFARARDGGFTFQVREP